jgi:hypothetical protein
VRRGCVPLRPKLVDNTPTLRRFVPSVLGGNVRGRDHEEEQNTNEKTDITNTVVACAGVVFTLWPKLVDNTPTLRRFVPSVLGGNVRGRDHEEEQNTNQKIDMTLLIQL